MWSTEPDPRDTIRIIDQLVQKGLLDERNFRNMHHFGGSLSGFRRYCSTINNFRRESPNRRLHEVLRALLDSHSQQRR
jgi:hypothetical protein